MTTPSEAKPRGPGAELDTTSQSDPAGRPAPNRTGTVATPPAPDSPPAWPFLPHALIFGSSACIMAVEIVAGRLIGRYLGNSVYTWTSVIGVVLAGISLGNLLGGRLADRLRPQVLLGWLFLASSISCASCLFLNHALQELNVFAGLLWPARILVSVVLVFLLPALILGTISPVTAKWALERSTTLGSSLGAVYAWGAAGSIAGTLLTGFILIALLGSKAIILGLALLLALAGLALGPSRPAHLFWIAVLLLAMWLARTRQEVYQEIGHRLGLREPPQALFARDSQYQFIQVFSRPSQDDPARQLRSMRLDFMIHGHVDLKDPGFLEYRYERLYSAITRRVAGERPRQSALFLGGGSFTFPRWLLRQWPGSQVEVAEIDPLVVEAATAAMGLDPAQPIHIRIEDARTFLQDLDPQQRYDFIYGDAYNHFSVPWHLATVEFHRLLARHLNPTGCYLLNVIENFQSGRMLGSFVLTLQQIFPFVYVFNPDPQGVHKIEGRETYVVAATRQPLLTVDWQPGHRSDFPGSAIPQRELQWLTRRPGMLILTDDFAPVEDLTAPIVRSTH